MRKCLVCGKKLKIRLNEDRTYVGGYYFGEIKLPIGKGNWKKVGEIDTLKPVQDRTDIVKWSGREEGIEYWECDRCYKK